jgi:hypothetical protein
MLLLWPPVPPVDKLVTEFASPTLILNGVATIVDGGRQEARSAFRLRPG